MHTILKDTAYDVNGNDMALADHQTEFFTRDGFYFRMNRQQPISFTVGNVNNALKRGKTCKFYSVISPYSDEYAAGRILDLVDSLKELFLIIDNMHVEQFDDTITVAGIDVKIYQREDKGIRVWSPFANLNKLKKAPAKWNMTYVYRALLNGQFIDLKCDSYYTDDYYHDAATNYRKGALEAAVFVRKIIEHNSGWRVWANHDDPARIHVSCHHFDNNSFRLQLTA